jgi:hypothetical protein
MKKIDCITVIGILPFVRSSVPSFLRSLTISIVSIFSSSYLNGPGFVIVAIAAAAAAAVLSAFG